MKLKKIISSATALALSALMLAGCSGSNAPGSSTTSADNTTTAAAAAKNDDTAANESEAADDNTEGDADLVITASEVNIAIQPSASFTPLYIVREKGWLE